jgi:hypothetical protein
MRGKLLTFALLLFPAVVNSSGETPLFAGDELLKAVLNAPVSQAYKQKKQDTRLYLNGSWSYRQAGEDPVRLTVKIRTRGNFRRKTCALPPLQLNFRKKDVKNTLFARQDKLKMVSPCKSSSKYQQYVYLEYLIYQLFALYSEYHFKARLVEVAYKDADEKKKPWQSTNFLIEDVADMAARSGLVPVDIVTSKRTEMDLGQTALVEVFQFMIGNVDYSTLKAAEGEKCCHNVKLIAPKGENSGLIPVAYDFDVSGLINATYAPLPAKIPIRRVTERYFTGWCKEEKRFREAIARINSKREAALSLFSDFSSMDEKYRKRAVKYLEKSYEQLNDKHYVDKYILARCRGKVIKG